ncbi:hypothetical protein [Ureaplasma urealyticum]|uniref:hypothetical protein n=1 Tax=Ureaplasma urealyticum TaxID=2130 RepID=UPI00307D0DCD
MNYQIFIHLLENKQKNLKSSITLPIILEFKDDIFKILPSILEKYKEIKIINNTINNIVLKINNKTILISKSITNEPYEYNIVNVNKKNDIYSEDNNLVLFNLVNYIIEKIQGSIKYVNFWTIQMSAINWVYFVTYNFNKSYLTDYNWKKYVFKIKEDETKGIIQTNLLRNYGFVDFIVQSKSQNFLKAQEIQNKILKCVLNLDDHLNDEYLKELYKKYETYKIFDKDHKYLVINIE